ncbi:MAG: hypothetical protein GY898_25840 [Proteobacteria bacterium]|nr:hypothetical protein [Pseudomonadota bacterium]
MASDAPSVTRRVVIHALLAATTVAFFLPQLGRGLMLYDLGELVFYADKVRAGATPGTDYVVNAYGPGRYVLVATLWEMFGRSFGVIWGLFLVLRILIASLSFELARKYVGEAWAMLPVFCLWVAPGPLHKGFYLAGTLALALALVHYLEMPGRRRAIGLGLVIAAVAFFRLDLGGFGVVVAGLACVAVPRRRADLLIATAPLLGGLIATALMLQGKGPGVFGAVIGQLGADIAMNQSVQYPHFPGPGQLVTFDRLDPWLMYFPFVVFAGLATLLLRSISWGDGDEDKAVRRRKVAVLFLLGLLTMNQVRMKPEIGHLFQAGPLLWMATALLLSRQHARGRAFKQTGRVRATLLAGVALPILLAGHAWFEHRGELYTGSFTIAEERIIPLETPLGRVWLNEGEHELLSGTLEALARLPMGPMWVPTNQPLLYALADRPDITGYPTVLYFAESRQREAEVIARLKELPPPVVVFIDDTVEGPERLLQSAAPLAQGYLLANYEEVVRVQGASVMVRRELAAKP